MKKIDFRSLVVSVAIAATTISFAAPASAQVTQFAGGQSAGAALPSVETVQFRRGYYGRGYYGRGRYGRGYGYRRGVGAGLAGLAAGAVIGGAIASQAGRANDDGAAYCESRYRSYDPASGTYLGNDGVRHPCP